MITSLGFYVVIGRSTSTEPQGAAEGFIHILSMGEYNFHFKGTCVVQYHHYGAPVPWVVRLPPAAERR